MEQPNMQQGPPQEQGQEQGDPQLQKQIEAYAGGMLQMVHNKKTRDNVYNMLKSAPPEKSIPQTALTVMKQMEEAVKQKGGQRPSLEVLLGSGVSLVAELIEVSNAGQFHGPEQITDEKVGEILQASIQAYIEDGVRRKVIDPIELQKVIEPLMNEEQQQFGLKAGHAAGVPAVAGQQQAMEVFGNQRVQEDRAKTAQQMAGKQRVGQLQQQGGQR